GWCCEEGKGVEKDLSRAVYWYGKAAEQGDGGAMYKLGWCFLNGVGVQRDKGRAAYYYNKAARQGNLLAKIALEALV
ncbi:MAG: sel1 repeat family protein, partial [Clostridia bacterium]|nr:sel1 repeat family protein [Clostridia bacterium]